MRGRLLSAFIAAVAGVSFASPARAGIIYVDAEAWGANNGISWFDAFNELTLALGVSSPGDEIWVAEGTYIPLGTAEDSFVIPPGVKLLGGFRGTEVDSDQRDPTTHICILDGDVNGDDEPGFVNRSDNRRHVVRATSPTPGTVLDGFIVRGGYAVNAISDLGGGLFVFGGSIKVAQCTFIANGAGDGGGGACFAGCEEVRIYDCLFSGNATHPDSTSASGGGVLFTGALGVDPVLDVQRTTFLLNVVRSSGTGAGGAVFAAPSAGRALEASFRDCDFTGNVVDSGTHALAGACAVYSWGRVEFTRCRFHLNAALAPGAAGAGAIEALDTGGGRLAVVSCVFGGNTASWTASAIYSTMATDLVGSVVAGNSGSSALYVSEQLTAVNCTIAGNTRSDSGAAGIWVGGDAAISNCIIRDNSNSGGSGQDAQLFSTGTLTVDYSCVEGWDGSLDGTGSFDAPPRFMDPDGADDIPGTRDDDYRVRGGSPCIDAADNSAVPSDTNDVDDDGDTGERLPLDLDLNPRRLDDTGMPDAGNGNAPYVDIGAYEFQGTTCIGDFDGDGTVNTIDVLVFLNAWVLGDASADIDGNGLVDTRDVLSFLNAWTAGC